MILLLQKRIKIEYPQRDEESPGGFISEPFGNPTSYCTPKG
jgi:hypothetical protein